MKICPQCRSKDITLYQGGVHGKYICKKCGYIGEFIIEIEDIDKLESKK